MQKCISTYADYFCLGCHSGLRAGIPSEKWMPDQVRHDNVCMRKVCKSCRIIKKNIMFEDRSKAGILLAEKLKELKLDKEGMVLAIPRGGVVVGAAIARNLKIPLSVLVIKKLGAPGNSELAIGAVAPDGIGYLDWEAIKRLDIGQEYLDEEIERKSREVEEREKKYQISQPEADQPLAENLKNIILVDDGIATGATTMAAIKYLKSQISKIKDNKLELILAVPVIAKEAYDRLKSEIEGIVTLEIADDLFAVGQFYRNFEQITDREVENIISRLGNLS